MAGAVAGIPCNRCTPTIVTAEHARHVIDIIEAGYRASETGQTQELGTSFEALSAEAL